MDNFNVFEGLGCLINIKNITSLTWFVILAGLVGLTGITGIAIISILCLILLVYIIYLIYSKKIIFNISIKVENDELIDSKNQIMNYNDTKDWNFCFDTLKQVSRSFNIVIQQLDTELKNVICIFYLVLRGLDTIEDDMSIAKDKKMQMLNSFYNDIENKNFTLDCGDKPEYKNLMKNFNKVIKCYKRIHPKYQVIIKNITKQMAHGMVEFIEKKELQTTEEYDLYCHYVAGLVGIGLSEIFTKSGNELKDLTQYKELSNIMGTFLQKTNIIRDLKEDMDESRIWWPINIVKKYVNSPEDLLKEENEKKALECLNDLIINAMKHIPQCIEYLSMVYDPKHFRFCAIPQVVAIQTLATLFNNKNVFKQTEKLNKIILARIFMEVNDLESVLNFYIDAIEKIENKIQNNKHDIISKINLQEFEKIKGYLIKYVIENSSKNV
jgi:farnesyl-diphosphate farnesyltransferase